MRCPRCAVGELDPTHYDADGMVTCRCGHRAYAGYVAEADALAARSAWLVDRVAAGDPAPAAGIRARYGVWTPPGATPGGAAPTGPGATMSTTRPWGAPQPEHPGLGAPTAQTILLGIGALLLVVAGAVFAAVVWDRLGASGQVVLMLTATSGVGALAIRLRGRLAGTAEALAVVAAGLAAIDLIAAPLLGLIPERWLTDPTSYPAVAFAALGAVLLGLNARFGIRAWSWLAWGSLLAAAWFVVPAVVAATDSVAWSAAAIVVPALTSLAMLAASGHPGRWPDQRVALRIVGALGLLLAAAVTAAAATERDALPGAVVATAATAVAAGAWAVADRGRNRLVALGAAALGGTTAALLLGLPPEPQPVWLAAAAALAGLGAGLVLWLLHPDRWLSGVAACAVWITWAALRIDAAPDLVDDDAVVSQLSVLALLVGVVAFVVAWWIPACSWIGALLCFAALLLAPGTWEDPIEGYSLSFAALLLAAGLLWRRQGPTPSLQWLGPAVAVALLPSAIATWAAPWALDVSELGTTWHLVRLGGVLVAGVAAAVVGARLRLGGLLIPAAVALLTAASAQVWSGLSTLPRWVGLAIAGALLVVAGARIEHLRAQGRRAVGWVEGLR